MAVKRSKNWLSQQRVDTVHLREVESAVVGDFNDLAGKLMGSGRPIVVHGMTISMGAAVGDFATHLVLNTADSILLHGTASEPGAIFVVPSSQPAETLNTSNPIVIGGFTPNAINYIGIDLIKKVDPTTVDTVKFRSATTKKEFSQQVPLARTLGYRILISVSDFNSTTNVAPVAKVTLDTNGIVLDVTDCREMMFRLGSGGTSPNPLSVYAWPGGRTENPVTSTSTSDPFTGADKSVGSFIDFFHAMESRLWEVGGGEHWYSPTTDRDVLFVRDPSNVFPSDNENFEVVAGPNLHWKGLAFIFGNSTAIVNPINDQTVNGANTNLADGDCLYVDLHREANTALTMVKVAINAIGTPAIPGSRHIVAYRIGSNFFVTGDTHPVGFAFTHATDLAYGVVKTWKDTDTDAVVPAVNSNGIISARGLSRKYDSVGTLTIGADTNDTEVDIARATILTHIFGNLTVDQGILANNSLTNGTGLTANGNGTGVGIRGTGGGTNAAGGSFTGGATNGYGIEANGTGSGYGVHAIGGSSASFGVVGQAFTGSGGGGIEGIGDGIGNGVTGQGGSGGTGVVGQGNAGGAGVIGNGGSSVGASGVVGNGAGTGGVGVTGIGSGTGEGIYGTGAGIKSGVYGTGDPIGNGNGVEGHGSGGGAGVKGQGGGTSGNGGSFVGGAGGGLGIIAIGGSAGASGIQAEGHAGGGNGIDAIGRVGYAGISAFSASGYGGDFTGNATKTPIRLEPQNFTPGTGPSSPLEGDIFMNSNDHKLYFYNGSTWTSTT